MPSLTAWTFHIVTHLQRRDLGKDVLHRMSSDIMPWFCSQVSVNHCLHHTCRDRLNWAFNTSWLTSHRYHTKLHKSINQQRLWICCAHKRHPTSYDLKLSTGRISTINQEKTQGTSRQNLACPQIRQCQSSRGQNHATDTTSPCWQIGQKHLRKCNTVVTLENSMINTQCMGINAGHWSALGGTFRLLYLMSLVANLLVSLAINGCLQLRRFNEHERRTQLIGMPLKLLPWVGGPQSLLHHISSKLLSNGLHPSRDFWYLHPMFHQQFTQKSRRGKSKSSQTGTQTHLRKKPISEKANSQIQLSLRTHPSRTPQQMPHKVQGQRTTMTYRGKIQSDWVPRLNLCCTMRAHNTVQKIQAGHMRLLNPTWEQLGNMTIQPPNQREPMIIQGNSRNDCGNLTKGLNQLLPRPAVTVH